MRAVVTDSVSHQLSAMQPSKPLGNLLTFSESCCCCLVLTPWTAAHQASPSFTISRNVLKFMFTELVMPSTRLLFCFPLLPLPSVFPSIKVFSSELALHIRWPKYRSFSFSISPSIEYSGLISFRLLAVQRTLKSLLQHHNLKASILWHSAFFMAQLSHPYMTAGKTIAFMQWTFAGKMMSAF